MEDSLYKRGKSLEDAFFRERDKQLLENLQAEMQQHQIVDGLAAVTGIKDKKVLEKLASQQIRAETLVAVALIPLVAVAWADGVVQSEERDAILKALHENGIQNGSAAAALLDSWLQTNPSGALTEAWCGYVGAMQESIDPTAYNQLKTTVLHRAREVASASGGFLGLNAASSSEIKVINELQKALDK